MTLFHLIAGWLGGVFGAAIPSVPGAAISALTSFGASTVITSMGATTVITVMGASSTVEPS
jgi:hypothetical protein